MTRPAQLLDQLRQGEALRDETIRAVVRGACDGTWNEAQLGAFLMAVAIRDLDEEGASSLTRAMLESGEQWRLGKRFDKLVDKHSTGGVGDKTSLVIGPLLAACGVPVVMLTGRALGHTGGTADKLEMVPGLRLAVDRERCVELLEECGLAIGVATEGIAPADRILYRLRDQTGTVPSLALVTASILSKKLATGANAIVFDVKTGDGAIFPDIEVGRRLAERMVSVCRRLGCSAAAWITDMNQPLGRWVGGACEVNESIEVLDGAGESRLRELCVRLSLEAAEQVGADVTEQDLEAALDDGRARSTFLEWAAAQGAEDSWIDDPLLPLAPEQSSVRATAAGVLTRVHTRRVGWKVAELATDAEGALDAGIALRIERQIGDEVAEGEELARLYSRQEDAATVAELQNCFEVSQSAQAPVLLHERIG